MYKNSTKSVQVGIEYEQAQYKGNFRNGKRDGQGMMVWADGAVFEGTWQNDQRKYGKMIMNNGCVYIGHFKNDKCHGKQERLLLPTMTIYQGRFI